jgi:hypothetical protein
MEVFGFGEIRGLVAAGLERIDAARVLGRRDKIERCEPDDEPDPCGNTEVASAHVDLRWWRHSSVTQR